MSAISPRAVLYVVIHLTFGEERACFWVDASPPGVGLEELLVLVGPVWSGGQPMKRRCRKNGSLIKKRLKAEREHSKENEIMEIAESAAAATMRNKTPASKPSQQERESVARLNEARLLAERQMRQYDRVMAKEPPGAPKPPGDI